MFIIVITISKPTGTCSSSTNNGDGLYSTRGTNLDFDEHEVENCTLESTCVCIDI